MDSGIPEGTLGWCCVIGRLGYYLDKLRREFRSHGTKAVFLKTMNFLVRRWLFLNFLFEAVEYHLLSKFRALEATEIRVWRFSSVDSARVLIYAGYDPKSQILPHVIDQLAAFQKTGYQIVFVSTSPELIPTHLAVLQEFCRIVIHRKNQGYDFCSWKMGVQKIESHLGQLESLVLLNDSCLGPTFDLGLVIEDMIKAKGAVYGVTKSYEIEEYIQSYFFHFGMDLIRNGSVTMFFDRIRILNSKLAIVRYLEIGSSSFFKKMGIPLEALVDPKEPRVAEIMSKLGQTDPVVDPVGRLWNELRISPFYKRSNLVSKS